jgi:glycosyltransferase involved in cell wall biosynthesis
MYRSHDALLFYSIFAEPVALVLVEAFAAGIPVVAPAPPEWTLLIEPDQTCVCFRTTAAHDVAAAVQRTLDDTELRRRVRRAARDLVVHRFSLDATGDAYEAALEETVGRAVRLPGPPYLA